MWCTPKDRISRIYMSCKCIRVSNTNVFQHFQHSPKWECNPTSKTLNHHLNLSQNLLYLFELCFSCCSCSSFVGQSCYSARRYMLSMDPNIVQDSIPSFITALCMMFWSYYCFNIHYPSELASTLEFLQRYVCLLGLALLIFFTLVN